MRGRHLRRFWVHTPWGGCEGLGAGVAPWAMENPRTMGVDCMHSVSHHRNLRKRVVRARSVQRYKKRALELLVFRNRDLAGVERPRTRAACAGGQRPCPFVSCEHHLYLEATKTGGIKLRFPDLEPWELRESCALDVADRDGTSPEDVADLLNLTRERVRQLEAIALEKLRSAEEMEELRDGFDESSDPLEGM